jgi:SAM-dependent methyltransferase
MAVCALKIVAHARRGLPAVRDELERLATGKDPYVVRMWREALAEAEGQHRGPHCDPLAFPYLPFLPEQFGVSLDERAHVLDLGCLGGFGLFDLTVRRLAQGLPLPRLVGVDVDRESLELGSALAPTWARPNQLIFQHATGESMPFASGSFDLVIARSVLQYLHIRPAVRELARVVRPRGLVLIQVHAPGYYMHQIVRHARRPLQAAYYGRALVSGLIFATSLVQPRHRWFKEAAVTYRRLLSLCRGAGLEPVWSNRNVRRPLVLFERVQGASAE